jgi:uncharacterized membrane protein
MIKHNKALLSAFLLVSTFLGALGQLMFKIGVSSQTTSTLILYILGGGVFYLISTVFYFYVLSRAHLGWAYSFGGLSYIFTVLLALLVLNESIPALRWVGVLVIAVGVAFIGMS